MRFQKYLNLILIVVSLFIFTGSTKTVLAIEDQDPPVPEDPPLNFVEIENELPPGFKDSGRINKDNQDWKDYQKMDVPMSSPGNEDFQDIIILGDESFSNTETSLPAGDTVTLIDPLVIDPTNIPSTIRGRLTGDGILLREVIWPDGSGDLENVGGVNVEIDFPEGPYEVGVQYPLTFHVSHSNEGSWTTSDGSFGIPYEILAFDTSSISIFYDEGRSNLNNGMIEYDGKTALQIAIHGTLSIATHFVHSLIVTLIHPLLDLGIEWLVDKLPLTAENAELNGYFATENIDYLNHSTHDSVEVIDPKAIRVVFGDDDLDANGLAEISSMTITMNVEFEEGGVHEIIFAPDFRANVHAFSSNPITGSFWTQFEYRDDLIFRVNVEDDDSEPYLTNPQILPSPNGDPTTPFTFKVTYVDADNDAPDSVKVIINGSEIALSASGSDYAAGVEYSSSPMTFDEGTYIYSFKATQGSIVKTTNNFIFNVFDQATGHDLTLQSLELSKSSAEPGDSVTIRAQVNNSGIYTENNIVIDVTITGPSGYSWTDSKNIGSLDPFGAGSYIWGEDVVTIWSIENDVAMGDFQISATVSSASGDENWSDNTKIRSIRVSDQDPAFAAYSYKYYQIEWTSNHPATYYPGDLMGPLNTSYDGNNYTMYVHKGSNDFRIHLEKNNVPLVEIFDNSYDYDTGYYEDNDDIFFAVDFYSDNIILMRAGHPVTGASMTPAQQSITMGETDTYIAHIPCSSCSYGSSDPTVYKGNNSDNPRPYLDVDLQDDYNWDVDQNGQDFTITAEPWTTSAANFVFMTEGGDLTTTNYMIFGEVTGYVPPDNPPTTNLSYPYNNTTVSGTVNVTAAAIDDNSISKVEFLINGVVKSTDTSSPYTFSWNTTAYSDGSYTVAAKAYDSKNQTAQDSVNVVVDNQAPVFSNIQHSPQNPSDQDDVVVSATITDASSISVADLFYSSNGGTTWNQVSMSNTSGTTWQGTIPAQSQGAIQYKLDAADSIGRSAQSSTYQYSVTDQTPPEFYGWIQSPSDLTEESSGIFRVTVSIWDVGGSGIGGQTPQFDYRIGSSSYDGFENMTNHSGDTWYFDIPSQDWDALQGQTIFYKATISDNASNSTTTEESELIDSINDAPVIDTFSPTDTSPTMDPETCQTFSVIASDEELDPLTYAWKLDENIVGSSTSYQYCPTSGDIGSHDLVISVNDGNLFDAQAWSITVIGDAPEIDIQRPAGNSIPDGGTDNLGTVSVGSKSFPYTIDNSNGTANLVISGVTVNNLTNASTLTGLPSFPLIIPAGNSATLNISFAIANPGAFSLDIDINNNDSNEDPYDIKIQGTAIDTGNDDMVNATVVTSLLPYTNMLSTAEMTVEAGEPDYSCGWNVGKTVWYRVTAPSTGHLLVSTTGSDFDTVIHVFEDAGGSLLDVDCNDDLVNGIAKLLAPVTSGKTYLISVGGEYEESGNLSIEIDLPGAFTSCWSVDVPSAECNVLNNLYTNNNGSNWDENDGWFTNNRVCSWDGIWCGDGKVSGLSLGYNNLSGSLTTHFTDLTGLWYLWISGNELSGNISTILRNIPTGIGNLYLGGNDFTGTITAGDLNFTTLYNFDVSGTGAVTGDMSTIINNLPTTMIRLYLDWNNLSGTVPASISNFTNLGYLDLSGNNLNGDMATIIGNLPTSLRTLAFWNNQFTGTIPSMGAFTNLYGFDVEGNNLTGDLSTVIGNLPTGLDYLYLSWNNFSGSVPSMSSFSYLYTLGLDGIGLTDNFSTVLGNLPTDLGNLYLGYNNFSGGVPSSISNFTYLRSLYISDNSSLSGTLPLEITNLNNLYYFRFSGTNLCAPVSSTYAIWAAGLYYYDPNVCGTPPTGSFTAPTAGGTLMIPRTSLSVDASDPDGEVVSVAFSTYYDGYWHDLGMDTNGADGWEYQWNTADIAEQTVEVQALITDNAANQTLISLDNISLSETITFGYGYESRGGRNGDEEITQSGICEVGLLAEVDGALIDMLQIFKPLPDSGAHVQQPN